MPGSSVVIVESPAKAKTINKYLGADFTVVASFGHIRDLPAKDGSVRPDEDFAMDWEQGERSKRHIDEIARLVKSSSRVYLATDPDREGEAIAWHVQEILAEKRLLGKVEVQRVTFNEITKSAVQAAMKAPRQVNRELVEAYLARRALDYLVGFTLSPVLWRKLPGSRSAGRVQSVALRLVCEREAEIEAFRAQEYWTVEVVFQTADGALVTARLIEFDGKKLDKFALGEKGAADAAVARIKPLAFSVASVEKKQVRRNPYPPFTTSTLQQEASRKLGFGATRTMKIAQKLYEGIDIGGETVGLITYMRTDGVSLSGEAITAARQLIDGAWGERYLPNSPRVYKTTAKNAQEAHEAIRPTDLFRRPEQVAAALDKDELRLYELIWKRTVASQMASAVFDQVSADIASPKRDVVLRATGSVLVFDGFLRVYQEGRDDIGDDDDAESRLPPVKEGDPLAQREIKPEQHFTQPPPRFTEASLVKRLEELGIGRPSTYASILQVLQDRDYVRLEKKRFIPEDRGRLVTAFLESFFLRYVEYNFTADLENQLDDVSGGRIDWKLVLREFWRAFSAAVEDTRDLTITQVIDTLDAELGPHFFPADAFAEGADPRRCPGCGEGRLGLKLSRNGAFVGCSRYPECRYTRPLAVAGNGDQGQEALAEGPKQLGNDPATGLPVSLRRGPYGAYVQLGPAADAAQPTKGKDRNLEKPPRVSLPKNLSPAEIDLAVALKLLALPRLVGRHPESGEEITAGIGRFGPYLRHGNAYKNLTPDDDVLTIGLNRAVVMLGEAKPGRTPTTPAKVLGDHPDDSKPVSLGSGRFGPYVKHGKIFASIPKAMSAEDITLDQALALIAAKAAKSGGKPAPAAKKAKTAAPAKKAQAAAPAKKIQAAAPAEQTQAAAPAKKPKAAATKAAAPAAVTVAAVDEQAPAKPKRAAAAKKPKPAEPGGAAKPAARSRKAAAK
ncbi:MAG: type I DNA topoisomerase [Azospirillum sp.]|nr:type I DNA topoisomerase [Azospirillum sp.]